MTFINKIIQHIACWHCSGLPNLTSTFCHLTSTFKKFKTLSSRRRDKIGFGRARFFRLTHLTRALRQSPAPGGAPVIYGGLGLGCADRLTVCPAIALLNICGPHLKPSPATIKPPWIFPGFSKSRFHDDPARAFGPKVHIV